MLGTRPIFSVLDVEEGRKLLEAVINEYISRELVSRPELLPLKNDTQLLDSGILDSLALLKLVMFMEQEFQVEVVPEELVPENFATIETIANYIRTAKSRAREI